MKKRLVGITGDGEMDLLINFTAISNLLIDKGIIKSKELNKEIKNIVNTANKVSKGMPKEERGKPNYFG